MISFVFRVHLFINLIVLFQHWIYPFLYAFIQIFHHCLLILVISSSDPKFHYLLFIKFCYNLSFIIKWLIRNLILIDKSISIIILLAIFLIDRKSLIINNFNNPMNFFNSNLIKKIVISYHLLHSKIVI